MAQHEWDRPADESPGGETDPPRHFTCEPWWVVPLGGVAAVVCVLINYDDFQRTIPGLKLGEAVSVAGGLGLLASALLVARSHVRSVVWSNVVLWLGILLAAGGVSVLLALTSH